MHKETVSGKVVLNRIKVPKGKLLTASRKNVDTSFNRKTIDSITDTGIQKILISFLEFKGNNPEIAFSPEGLEEMNANIKQYNNGVPHKPIKKVRIFELGSKFPLGDSGNKKDKYVEAAKGTNLFFAIFQKEDGTRTFETYPFNMVIERLKQGLGEVPEINEKGEKLIFSLSPNDLVYVPSIEENQNQQNINLQQITAEQVSRIYKMVSCTGTECYFINHHIASLIKPYDAKSKIGELGSINKLETSFDGIRIKEVCIKLKVDRLGRVTF
jgi:CRISPR-associated endonuclease Csn1